MFNRHMKQAHMDRWQGERLTLVENGVTLTPQRASIVLSSSSL